MQRACRNHFGIILGCMKQKAPEIQKEKKTRIHIPEHGGWISPKRGLVHDKEITVCFHRRTPKMEATKFI